MTLTANWNYPTAVRFGPGRIRELAEICTSIGLKAPLIVTDPGGFIVMWNATAELLYGWSEREVLGRAIVELLVPNADDDLAPTRRKPIANGYEADRLLISKSGELLDVYVPTRASRTL